MSQQKIFILLGGLALFAIMLVIGVNALLKSVPVGNQPKSKTNAIAPPGSTIRIEAPNGDPNAKVNILDTSPEDPRLVTYTENGFSPNAVTVKITDSVGCLVTIRNKTTRSVRVGVNPHNPAGDPGANYGEIAPNEDSIIDPRYTGLPGIILHDHAKPANELAVSYGAGCH